MDFTFSPLSCQKTLWDQELSAVVCERGLREAGLRRALIVENLNKPLGLICGKFFHKCASRLTLAAPRLSQTRRIVNKKGLYKPWWTFRIFFIFSARGRGRGVRGAKRGGGGRFLLKIPRVGVPGRGGAEGLGASLRGIRGGGAKFFFIWVEVRELPGKFWELPGNFGNFLGSSGLLLKFHIERTCVEVAEKLPGNFRGSPGSSPKLGGA